MPTWLLFLILLVIILIIIWILLSGNPIVEEDEEPDVVEAVEEPMVAEVAVETPAVAAEEIKEEASVELDEIMEPVEEILQPDDLKKIEGIGPKISGLLIEKGIKTFAQLAEKDADEIQAILDDAKIRIANPATWAEQAKLAAAGNWDSLTKLQDDLKGGRREPK
ncbi:MAG: helix-hairpin-helix domain-containing protein [Anaerolineae bacterium]|jgi:predicted flap endonuclease-1-like 5' DNA nuclease|nr:helix-hairpin-helix domain-containing protein [Anaerolineae bacterium]